MGTSDIMGKVQKKIDMMNSKIDEAQKELDAIYENTAGKTQQAINDEIAKVQAKIQFYIQKAQEETEKLMKAAEDYIKKKATELINKQLRKMGIMTADEFTLD